MYSLIFRFSLVALLLLSSAVALAQSSSLWTLTQTEPTVAVNAKSQSDIQQAEVLTQLVKRLQKTSPNGLASLQWVQLNRQLLADWREGGNIAFAAPNGDVLTATTQSKQNAVSGVTTLRASGDKLSVTLSQMNDAVSGTVIIEGVRWKLTARGEQGALYKNSDLPSLSDKGIKDDSLIPPQTKKTPNVRQQRQPVADAGNTADIVIAYTTPLLDTYGGKDGVLARINDVVVATNEAYANSNVDLQVNVLDIIEVEYDPFNTIGSEQALEAVTGNGTGAEIFTHARAQTERMGADFLVAFRPYVGDGICGIAWLGGYQDSPYNPGYMVSHTSLDCGDEVNAHEMGHNMGLSHSRRQNGSGHVYHYALGHGVDYEFTTIMAYPQAFGYAGREFKFSSPDLTCADEYPCGIDHTDTSNGADAARALTLRRDQIVSVRARQEVSGELVVVQTIGGEVRVNDQLCAANNTCSFSVTEGSTVTLEALESGDMTLREWRGGWCSGAESLCEVVADDAVNVIAEFKESFIELPIDEALDNDELTFETFEPSPWVAVDNTFLVGGAAMRSGAIADSNSSVLSTWVEGYGELTFAAKLSSELNYDGLRVFVNDQEQRFISGDREWQYYSVEIADTGRLNNRIDFVYSKDGSGIRGEDRAWLDDVQFTLSDEQPPIINLQVHGQGGVSATGILDNCDDHCEIVVSPGESITLVAEPLIGKAFLGWGGACRGQQLQCEVTVEESVDVFAYFSSGLTTDYAVAVDNERLAFSSTAPSWLITDVSSTAGDSSVVSADINDDERSAITTTLYGAGELQFDWRASSERGWDHLRLYINGELLGEISGETSWQTVSYTTDEVGPHTVTWAYEKDGSVSSYEDRGYLDNVRWSGDYPVSYNVAVSVNNDHGAVRTDTGFYCRGDCDIRLDENETVVLYAEPDAGFEFLGWQGACSGTQEHCELSPTADQQVEAIFSAPVYQVRTQASVGGILTPAVQEVVEGDVALINVSSLAGYALSSIAGCEGDMLNESQYQTAPIVADCTVQADFVEQIYTVTFDLGTYGSVLAGPALEQQVRWGAAAEEPNFAVAAGWHFAGWDSDFSRITAPLMVAANYQQIAGNNRVTLNTDGQGRLDIEPVQYISDGNYLSVTVSPLNGLSLSREVTGSCPAGEWTASTYRFGPIAEDCDVNFSFNRARGSGSILMILSAIAAEQAAKEDEEEK